MDFKDVINETADRLAKGADSIVKLGELVVEDRMLRNELDRKYRALGKAMHKWYVRGDIEFVELKHHFVEIEKIISGIIRIEELRKEANK